MTTRRLDGAPVAKQIKEEALADITAYKQKYVGLRPPCLVIISVGNDPASLSYISGKMRDCREVGIECRTVSMCSDSTFNDIATTITQYNLDASVDGIILQLPIDGPANDRADELCNFIKPDKDVDCLTDVNMGKLMKCGGYGMHMQPCTPSGIMELLSFYGIDLDGKKVMIINRSNLVGKPLAALMTAQNACVTVAHSHCSAAMLIAGCRAADIIVTAVGQPGFLTSDMLSYCDAKTGTVVIDVGISPNPHGKGVVGDMSTCCSEHCAAYTPVPGGVGLMTRAMLMSNVVEAWKYHVDK